MGSLNRRKRQISRETSFNFSKITPFFVSGLVIIVLVLLCISCFGEYYSIEKKIEALEKLLENGISLTDIEHNNKVYSDICGEIYHSSLEGPEKDQLRERLDDAHKVIFEVHYLFGRAVQDSSSPDKAGLSEEDRVFYAKEAMIYCCLALNLPLSSEMEHWIVEIFSPRYSFNRNGGMKEFLKKGPNTTLLETDIKKVLQNKLELCKKVLNQFEEDF